jgi:hypothetical protein
MTLEELKAMAADVARAMLEASAGVTDGPVTGTGGGSRHRGLPEELRKRFIAVRSELFQRGIYDPVLVRFDTATVTQASTRQIAEQLQRVVESLR